MSVNPEAVPPRDDDISVPLSDRPGQSPDAPRGGEHPEQPTGDSGGYRVPEAGRAAFNTRNESPAPVPDEPLPPQD
jgi:hypothetical protein